VVLGDDRAPLVVVVIRRRRVAVATMSVTQRAVVNAERVGVACGDRANLLVT
jgi:hypothetical protein